MKTKILVLALAPLLALLSGCESADSQQETKSNIHGDAGVGMQSMNTRHITPERPAN